ncbi:mitochondrial calcium uniporter regulator 1 isoform X1 [Nematostella vectensis]|uniref:mitochondrial calcium uniporter regulator 1 isoform X1 n=1 Tax=Nematostella vectensis TaxID=45351 RepID=UPI0020775F55|nr:mitochondrial calcium uniporter regulator 1 isoform X1 [Nematostella vectensis]
MSQRNFQFVPTSFRRLALISKKLTCRIAFKEVEKGLYISSCQDDVSSKPRSFSSYVSPAGVTFHFDTHKLILKLQENGFSTQQAESVTSCLVEIINTSISGLASNTLSTLDKERLEMKWKSTYDEVRNEMFLLEKSKFAQVKEENEKLKEKVKSLEQFMQDEMQKMKGSIRLDMSLEKSRRSEELAIRDQRIKDNGNKIETEIAKLGTQMETQKLDLIKYLVGSMVSCTTLMLAIWRIFKS